MQCNAMQCNAMQYDAMQYDAMQYDAMQYDAMQYDAMQCNAMRWNAINSQQRALLHGGPIQERTCHWEVLLEAAQQTADLQCTLVEREELLD
jgi:hypothetical protein